MKRIFLLVCMVISVQIFKSQMALAGGGWSWGIGYHNPPNATLGLNFMYLWTNWAFELGLGYINSTESKNSTNSNNSSTSNNVNLSVGGDLNLKYLFGSGGFRPYLQGGTYMGVGAQTGNNSGASASVGGSFLGAGLFFMGSSVDFYLGVISAGNGSFQVGLNF